MFNKSSKPSRIAKARFEVCRGEASPEGAGFEKKLLNTCYEEASPQISQKAGHLSSFMWPRLWLRLMINEKQTGKAGPTCSRCHTSLPWSKRAPPAPGVRGWGPPKGRQRWLGPEIPKGSPGSWPAR